MTNRQPVHSPFELRGGDRVELLDHDDRAKHALIDLLWRDSLVWVGAVVFTSPGSTSETGSPMTVGDIGCINPDAYLENEVFVHRRSIEDQRVTRAREVSGG